jgi:hypothetical protein
MKQIPILAVLAFASCPLLAADFVYGPPPKSPGPTATLGEVVASRAGVQAQGTPLAPGCGYGFSDQLLIPVIINTAGQNGTFFNFDYVIVNGRPQAQDILVGILPAGVSGVGQPTFRFTLNANTIYSIPEYLGGGSGRLSYNGVGSLLVIAVMPGTTTADPSGFLVGSARIWTREPGSTGTNSFTLWSTAPGSTAGNASALSVGVRQNSDFRSNYGIVNLDPFNSHTWTVNIIGGGAPLSGMVTVLPLSMQLLAAPSTLIPSSSGYFVYTFNPSVSLSSPWSAFGVTADNVTGDAWFSPALQYSF